MIDYAKNPEKWDWAPYFTVKEFSCKGSGECLMDADFMQMLYQLRADYNAPMIVTSGYRSPAYNASVSTTGHSGPHTKGRAVDLSIRGLEAYRLLSLALQHGFTGIGVKQHGSSRFLHLDTLTQAEGFPRPIIWSYP